MQGIDAGRDGELAKMQGAADQSRNSRDREQNDGEAQNDDNVSQKHKSSTTNNARGKGDAAGK